MNFLLVNVCLLFFHFCVTGLLSLHAQLLLESSWFSRSSEQPGKVVLLGPFHLISNALVCHFGCCWPWQEGVTSCVTVLTGCSNGEAFCFTVRMQGFQLFFSPQLNICHSWGSTTWRDTWRSQKLALASGLSYSGQGGMVSVLEETHILSHVLGIRMGTWQPLPGLLVANSWYLSRAIPLPPQPTVAKPVLLDVGFHCWPHGGLLVHIIAIILGFGKQWSSRWEWKTWSCFLQAAFNGSSRVDRTKWAIRYLSLEPWKNVSWRQIFQLKMTVSLTANTFFFL